MKTAQAYVSSVFYGALALGCPSEDSGDATQGSTSSTSSTTSGNQSGSVTSSPGSVTDETVGDSAPTMATATTTASATASDSSSTGEACSFLGCDDMNGTPWCDHFAQDCPEGQKCVAYADDGGNSWNALKCVDVTGTDKPGEPCTSESSISGLNGIESCIEGAMCWNTNAEGVGHCIALCTGSLEAPVCPNGTCTLGGEVLNLCLGTCDPLLQDCASSADLCIPNGDSFVCVLDVGGEEGQANDPCEFANVCDPGLWCLDPATGGAGCDPAAGGCCTPFCEFPDGSCPNPDQSCVQWFDAMMLPEDDPLLDIGVCGVPPSLSKVVALTDKPQEGRDKNQQR